jgi:hypothetical protein
LEKQKTKCDYISSKATLFSNPIWTVPISAAATLYWRHPVQHKFTTKKKILLCRPAVCTTLNCFAVTNLNHYLATAQFSQFSGLLWSRGPWNWNPVSSSDKRCLFSAVRTKVHTAS